MAASTTAAVSQQRTAVSPNAEQLRAMLGVPVRPDADPEINRKFRVEWLRRGRAMRERRDMTAEDFDVPWPCLADNAVAAVSPPPPTAVSRSDFDDFLLTASRTWPWLADLTASRVAPARSALRRGPGRGLRVRFAEDFHYEPPELTSDDRAWIAEAQAWRREQEEAADQSD